MQICPSFNYSTGYEHIAQNQQKAEIILITIIAVTIFACQFAIVIFLLPIRKLRHAVKELDLDVMEIIDKVTEKKPDNIFGANSTVNKFQNSGPSDHVMMPKPVFVHIKRTAGGFATLLIIAIIICVFAGMLLMQYFTAGNVTATRSSFDLNSSYWPIIDQNGSVGIIVPKNRGNMVVINTVAECNMSNGPSTSSCHVDFTGVNTTQFIIVDVGRLMNLESKARTCELYATVCVDQKRINKPLHFINTLTPVTPSLEANPPLEVFLDVTQEHSVPFSDDNTEYVLKVPVIRFYWTWIQMQAGMLLHFINTPSDHYLQAKISSSNYLRNVNGTIIDGTIESTWPECTSLPDQKKLAPLFSFEVDYDQDNFMTASYKVQYNPLLSWLFSVLVTIGSLTSLRSVLRFLFIVFAEYWSQAGILMWIGFVIYTGLTVLVFVGLRFYAIEAFSLSWISAWIAVLFWAVVLVDAIRRSKNRCQLYRSGYEPIAETEIEK